MVVCLLDKTHRLGGIRTLGSNSGDSRHLQISGLSDFVNLTQSREAAKDELFAASWETSNVIGTDQWR